MNLSIKKQLIFGHIATLLVGGFIYILFRSDSLRMFSWYKQIDLYESITDLRLITKSFIKYIPSFCIYSLPDGLWSFSYVSLMLVIWKNKISVQSLIWIMCIPIIAIISEFGQLLGIISGTFDSIDLLFYFLGSILPLIIFKNSLTYNLNQK